MRGVIVSFLASLALVAAVPANPQRIVGGTITTISQHPFMVSLLWTPNLVTYTQYCGATVLTTTTILTAAHCIYGDPANRWRARVGSSYGNSGGSVHSLQSMITHPQYNTRTSDCDFALVYVASNLILNNNVQRGSIAGANYFLGDNQPVVALGWGTTSPGGSASEQLRRVDIWTVNQATCRQRYAELGLTVTDAMLCSGWLDVGGRDQCQGDSGGPLLHNNVVVGVCSWGSSCALARYPGVNARVTHSSHWIQSNAK